MTGQSASDSAFAVAARHHSRALCASCAATREPSCFFSARTVPVASASCARKRPGSQIWNLWPRPTKAISAVMPAWRLQRVREDHASLAVDLQRLARAVERERESVPLVRIGREALDQRLDLGEQRIAPGVHRRLVQRRIAIESVEAVARQHRAVGGRDRDASLRVEAQGVVRDEPIHSRAQSPVPPRRFSAESHPGALEGRAAQTRPRSPSRQRLGIFGISWDLMVVKRRPRAPQRRHTPTPINGR